MTSIVDASGWSKRDCWRLSSGELAVRPGLRKIAETASVGKLIAPGAFTVRNDAAGGEVWHYLVEYLDNASTAKAPQLIVQDENLATVQSFAINSNRVPRIVTSAVVLDQLLITSPDFPSMVALVGSGVGLAAKVASDDGTLTALNVPRGICTSWAGSRVVVANGRTLNVSDPVTALGGSPQTFVAENQMELPGIVYGLHEAASGMLVAVTDQGVYGLDSSAASVGIIGDGGADWRMLNHHRVNNYGSSCVVRGRVYALTLRGFMLVDVENNQETILDEPMQSVGLGAGRYALEDFRAARIMAGEHGPIVGADDLQAAVMTDVSVSPPFVSWWSSTEFAPSATAPASSITGLLSDVDGSPLIVGAHGIYRAHGDFDGGATLTSTVTFPTGSLRGPAASSPLDNLHALEITASASVGGGTALKIRGAVRGKAKATAPAADENGITIGVDAWGTAAKRYTVTPLTSATLEMGDGPTSDVTIEIGADGGLSRISPAVEIKYTPSATKRPANKA